MLFKMKLNNTEFNRILKDQKNIEVRLADEKRRKLKVGDLIQFTNIKNKEKLNVEITDIREFNSFLELYNFYHADHFGAEVEELLKNIYNIYTVDEEIKYGVLAIKFKRRL